MRILLLIISKIFVIFSQFEIIGIACDKRDNRECFIKGNEFYLDEQHPKFVGMVLNGKATYTRLLIKSLE